MSNTAHPAATKLQSRVNMIKAGLEAARLQHRQGLSVGAGDIIADLEQLAKDAAAIAGQMRQRMTDNVGVG